MVPLGPMVRLPDTVKLLSTLSVHTLLPVPIVSDLQAELAERSGWLAPVKLASPIMASTEAVGTPAVQLPAVLQLLLTVPLQEVCASATQGTKTIARKRLPVIRRNGSYRMVRWLRRVCLVVRLSCRMGLTRGETERRTWPRMKTHQAPP